MESGPPRHPALRAIVQTIWVTTSGYAPPRATRERVLPTGAIHLVLRLHDEPLRLYADPADSLGIRVGAAIVGGARATAWVRDVARPVPTVGAQLAPGAAPLLLGVPADELAGRHLDLGLIWGGAVRAMQERPAEAAPAARREIFERWLVERLRTGWPIHSGIARALLQRAVEAGAELLRPAQDQFYGERSGAIRDPFGHEWLIGHSIEEVEPEEMQRRLTAMLTGA